MIFISYSQATNAHTQSFVLFRELEIETVVPDFSFFLFLALSLPKDTHLFPLWRGIRRRDRTDSVSAGATGCYERPTRPSTNQEGWITFKMLLPKPYLPLISSSSTSPVWPFSFFAFVCFVYSPVIVFLLSFPCFRTDISSLSFFLPTKGKELLSTQINRKKQSPYFFYDCFINDRVIRKFLWTDFINRV